MDEPLIETELADTEPQRRPGPWKLIVVVVVLTLVGVWLVPSDRPAELPTQAQLPRAAAPSLLAPDPVEAPEPPNVALIEPETRLTETALPESALGGDPSVDLPATAAGMRGGPAGSRARALIAQMRAKGNPDLDAVFAAATQARDDGSLTDAYLLLFYAAREGHAGAALALAEQADPATYDAADSVFESPDLSQALKWYEVAARSGDDTARGHLEALHERINKLAADGDPQAQRLALLFQ